MMKLLLRTSILLVGFISLVNLSPSFAGVRNFMLNNGFEDALGTHWNNTANRGITRQQGGAFEGNFYLQLQEVGATTGAGSFTFQTNNAARGGHFVAFSGMVRAAYDDGDDEGQIRIEFQNSAGGVISAVNQSIAASTTFSRVRVSGQAPANTVQVVFVVRIQNIETTGLGATTVDFDAMEATIATNPVILNASPSSGAMKPGEVGLLNVTLDNGSADALTGVEIVAQPADGVRVMPNHGTVDGKAVGSRTGSVIYQIGSVAAGEVSVFSVPFMLTSGVIPGKSYEILLTATSAVGAPTQIRVLIHADLDPLFDEGTIIGKVFNDLNKNGIQDSGDHGEEVGIGGVRLMTEEGIVIITGPDGKYHIPAVKPGRHVVKIDGHTLPAGTEFITEESFLVKTTSGLLSKANFAVLLPPSKIPEMFQEDLSVTITQGLDASKPVLDVALSPETLRVGVDRLAQEAVFSFDFNYPDFVKSWSIEVRDELGQEVWTGFGVGAPPAEVVWAGETNYGPTIKPGLYSYQFKIQDQRGNEDWSVLHFMRVLTTKDPKAREAVAFEIPSVGDFNLFKDAKRSIPLVAKPTLHIRGQTKKGNTITVNSYPAEVDKETGYFSTELYVSPGEKEISIVATNPEGESVSYREAVTVQDSTFFMVALAEEQFGTNFQDGSVRTLAEDDTFKDGFYEDGRLSFYLKGKIKGKFLVKAHYDTDDKRSALMTNLDPDDYYPVYGDASVRDYEAHNTLDRLFFVVEMNRSFIKWGSFKTNFNDTELSTHNRTLNGLKLHYETTTATAYGDPKSHIKAFMTEARHRADHNEFRATGGALYYLRNRNVIQGSEKIRVEIRDKIQDIAVHSYDLIEGQDYEIDYDEARILLSKPLSSVAAADTIVSSDILDGSPVYLIVDYEYEAGAGLLADGNRGIRGSTHFGDHLRVGVTYLQERRDNHDYDLRGIDMTLKLGRNTKVFAEYAETLNEQMDHAISSNGGLSFADLDPISGQHTRPRENAYMIRAESKPFKDVEVSGFIQTVEPGFSTDRIKSQEGFKKIGISARYKVGEYGALRYRYDHSEVTDQLLPFDENNVRGPYEQYKAHTIQAGYDDGQWLGNLEYRYQLTHIPETNLSPTLLSEIPYRNGLAGKIGYRLNERLLSYARVQLSIKDKQNNQWGGGLRYNLTSQVAAYVEQMFGNIGDSTLFGFERTGEGSVKNYANLRMVDRGIGAKALSTTIGSSFGVGEKSRVYSEREYSSFNGVDGYANIVGYEAKVSDKWSLGARFERRHLDNATTRLLDIQAENSLIPANTTNTISGTIAYNDHKRLRFRTYLEGRRDTDTIKLWQVVSRSSAEYQVNEDLSFLGKLDFGKSRFTDPADTPGDFFEFNVGFAYRPVSNDKLNILGRYSFIRDKGNDLQFATGVFGGVEVDERSHVVALDAAYDLNRYVGFVQKLAYKTSVLDTSVTDQVSLHNFLWANRVNFHVTRKWDVALEYRMLWQYDALETLRQGALIEVDREFYDYARIGLGYNFSDFDDDLTKSNNFDSHGPFVRMTGKF